MSRKEAVELTVMCAVCEGDYVLVQNKQGPNVWGITFPGGHVERGESFTAAAIRETWEEAGISISHPAMRGVMHWIEPNGQRYLAVLFRADSFTGTPRGSAEGEVLWVNRDGFTSLRLAENVETAFNLIFDGPAREWFLVEEKVRETI